MTSTTVLERLRDRRQVHSYFVPLDLLKPFDFDALFRLYREISFFWLKVLHLAAARQSCGFRMWETTDTDGWNLDLRGFQAEVLR